jgi:hypothetical protein
MPVANKALEKLNRRRNVGAAKFLWWFFKTNFLRGKEGLVLAEKGKRDGKKSTTNNYYSFFCAKMQGNRPLFSAICRPLGEESRF